MSDFSWSAHPAMRVALALGCGIALVHLMPEDGVRGEAVVSLALALAASGLGLARWLRARDELVALAAMLVVASSGALLAALDRRYDAIAHDALDVRRAECVGTLVEEPRQRTGAVELVLACDSILLRNEIVRTRARVLVRLKRDAAARAPAVELVRGDRVSVRGRLRAPRAAALPGAFDEAGYLRSRSIAMTMESDRLSEAHRFAEAASPSIHAAVRAARRRMRDFSREHVGGAEGEVVEALLSGDREGIERATRDAFAATGTLHVLAVSGLHVAVIALGLAVVTSWMPDRRAQFAAFALVLGAYTLVTGAGPSIVRAWIMATCFMLARLLGRRTRALNVLAFSAIAILIVAPSQLFDIGFQLSFAAVAGIVLFSRRIIGAVDAVLPAMRERAWGDWLVRTLAMTLAAQALTMPILLMHFGSAPALGLLLNLPVVPLTSCAMAAAALGVLASPAPAIAALFGATAYLATRATVAIVTWGASMPYASLALQPLAPAIALLFLMLLSWALLSRGAARVAIRSTLAVTVAVFGMLVARALDPLAPGAHPRAYIIPVAGGVVVAHADGDSLRAVGPTAAPSVRRRVATLAATLGLDGARLDSLGGAARVHAARPPIVVDRSRSAPRCASLDARSVLVAGLRAKVDRLIVLEYTGRWTPIAWH